ncbi:MAG: hypothetical protein AB4062_20150 [Crocosphaera sp.]
MKRQHNLTSKTNDQGFALPLVLGVGMILSVAATSMIIQAASQEKHAISQQLINKSSAQTDVAVQRIIHFLNQHRELIKKPTDQWQTTANEMMATSATGGSSDIEEITCDSAAAATEDESEATYPNPESVNQTMLDSLQAKTWMSIDKNDPSAGDYRLVEYQLDSVDNPTTAKLQIQARAVQDSNSNLNQRNAIKALEVVVSITEKSRVVTTDLPGLWISDTTGGTGGFDTNSKQSSGANQPINAITWIDCSQTTDWDSNAAYVNHTKIDPTAIAIDGDSMNPPAEVKQVKDDLPSVPVIPPEAYDLGSLNASNCYITLPRTSGNSWGGDGGSGCETINDRTSDVALDGVYHYHFTGDVTLSNSQIRINPPEGTKVVIHLGGGITLTGKGLSHDAATSCAGALDPVATYIGDPDDPSKLELYSHSISSLQPIDISDTTMISAFVHAPNTELKISQGQVRGAVWVKSMDASNSGGGSGCDRSIKQMDVGQIEALGGDGGKPQPYLENILSYRTIEAR